LHLRLAVDLFRTRSDLSRRVQFYKVTDLSPESFQQRIAEFIGGGSTEWTC